MKRFALAAAISVICVGAIAGCTSQTPGQAVGSANASSGNSTGDPFPTKTSSKPTSSSATPPKGPLAGISPCALLNSSDIATLRLTDQEEDTTTGVNPACTYNFTPAGALRIVIYGDLSINQIQGRTENTPVKVGKHDAIRGVTAAGGCAFSIKTSETSRVDVVASSSGDPQKGCTLGTPVAQAVEQKLPSS